MRLITMGASLILASCQVTKVPVPVTGSKADGIVTLAYTVDMFEVPVVDYSTALKSAELRCKAWGYQTAVAFGATEVSCAYYSGGSCAEERHTITYQCQN